MPTAEPPIYYHCVPWPNEANGRQTTHQPLPIRPYASLRDVRFVVDEGVAILRGPVPSFYLKQLAQEIVRKIEGVIAIVNELEVVTSAEPSDSFRLLQRPEGQLSNRDGGQTICEYSTTNCG